jgi:hypothetical protein
VRAVQKLQHHVRRAIGEHVPVDDVDHVRVAQRREQLGLALKSDHRLGVLDQIRQQQLERELALELEVMHLVDDAHAALAELAHHPVAPVDLGVDQRIVIHQRE